MGEVKILLVDDEELVLRSMEKTLLRTGFDVETAGDAAAAVERFKQAQASETPFSLAILDLRMPGFDGESYPDTGLALLDALLGLQADLPVVILTAFDDVERAKEAISRGAQTYLVKGRESALVQVVEQIMGRS